MTEKLNIVQSTTEPDKRNIWLKDNELKKFGAKGWSTIGGSNAGGGGTSTDKDALYIYVDLNTRNIIFNDKVFVSDNTEDSRITIHDKELYSILYSSLVNNNVLLCLKSISTNKVQFSGTSNWTADTEKIMATLLFPGDGIVILVYNQ